ncbi:MAG: phosphatidate cytidylyltransferase [Fimbriimonadales bacterium]
MLARVATAVVGIPLIGWASTSTSVWPFKLLILAIGMLMFWEFNSVEGVAKKWWAWILALVLIIVCLLPVPLFGENGFDFVFAIAFILLLPFDYILLLDPERPIVTRQFVWLFLPLGVLTWLRSIELTVHSGQNNLPADLGASITDGSVILLLFLCLWAGDTAAFIIGRALGRRKLAPAISPNKTWEGAIANLVAASVVGFAIGPLFGDDPGSPIGPYLGLGVGAIVGVLGQVGDLYESAWKRRHGVKDSGNLLPGHGGVLDRFDSLLFSAPAVATLFALVRL